MTPESHRLWKQEVQRQAQELCDAIQEAIDAHGRRMAEERRPPIMNAVFGALATVMGTALAAIEDPRHRKSVRKAFDRAVPQAQAAAKGRGHATVLQVGKPPQ